MTVAIATYHIPLAAQFSPGELSRAHADLDGITKCTQCHEVGNAINGTKCLGCHDEIKYVLDHNKGFHALNSGKACVDCHKEHLGRNASTFRFEEDQFNHALSGFALSGKHQELSCKSCHTPERVKEVHMKEKFKEHPHASYMGLTSDCNSCHNDPHKNKFDGNCSSCHTSAAWKQVQSFDHSKTRYPLAGKHASVSCVKCHTEMNETSQSKAVDFATKNPADCAPCHTSSHVSTFAGAACSSCHTPGGWNEALARPFSHQLTRYNLAGKHAALRCEQCHHIEKQANFSATFLLPFGKCQDCHQDKHNGEFAEAYKNDCSRCHNLAGYGPSTFGLTQHQRSRFELAGAHAAIPCASCHKTPRGLKFRFSSLRCEACHEDIHKGRFAAQISVQGCSACHSTTEWKSASFDHSATKFPLAGKHADAACKDCHRQNVIPGSDAPLPPVSAQCQSCHRDVHEGQFETENATKCERCHQPEGWRKLTFSHEAQSRFPLSGAHVRVACENCHKQESRGQTTFVRFKPLSVACASCHAERKK